ncbi:MAG: hypothetical protein ACOZCP_08615 [Pseudomonadota bacterium]
MTDPIRTDDRAEERAAANQGSAMSSAYQERRRRLLKGGLAATPLIMTLASRPSFAQGQCMSPMVFASLAANPATSLRPDRFADCHSHGYWKNHLSSDDPRTFSGVGFTSRSGDSFQYKSGSQTQTTTFGAATLYQVLWANGDNSDQVVSFARDCVCAYLDALLLGAAAGFTTTQITTMWNGVMGPAGEWSPVAGVTWGYAESRAWLDVLVGNAAL